MGERPPAAPAPPPSRPRRPRRPPRAAPWRASWLLLLALATNLTAALGHNSYGGCDLETCIQRYDDSLQRRGLPGPEGSASFCAVLYDYGACMHTIRRQCRGDLNYHTSNTMLVHLKTMYECNRRLKGVVPLPAGRPPPPPTSAPTTSSTTPASAGSAPAGSAGPAPACLKPAKAFRHCGLFGDPHLKTFRGDMQTCRVQGAWPLVDNPYLAVQVTNAHVLDGSAATATTKVTVLVKGSTAPGSCMPPKTKTYEATAEAPLPDAFIDGHNKSGPGEAVTIRYQETTYGASVEIRIQYIETTIIVRKVGRYLAFSTRMPAELVDGKDQGSQLCVHGCPLSERMDLDTDRGSVLSWADALNKCVAKSPAPGPVGPVGPGRPAADSNEVHGDLTDQYLDWCVFDLMTTGQDDFVLAARSAHRDTLTMDPGAVLSNRTAAQDSYARAASAASTGAGAGAAMAAAPAPLLLLLLLLACGLAAVR